MNDKTSTGNLLFPIFIKLNQIQTLLVGGGNVALEKLEAILKNSPEAKVHIVAAEIRRDEILTLIDQYPTLRLSKRPFHQKDLDSVDLAILATDDYGLHVQIRQVAKDKNILVNVADTPDLCDFYLCSIVKKGDLKIGISTNGKSPTLAKRMREFLTDVLPEEEEIQKLLDNLLTIRDSLTDDFAFKVEKLNEITESWIEKKHLTIKVDLFVPLQYTQDIV